MILKIILKLLLLKIVSYKVCNKFNGKLIGIFFFICMLILGSLILEI